MTKTIKTVFLPILFILVACNSHIPQVTHLLDDNIRDNAVIMHYGLTTGYESCNDYTTYTDLRPDSSTYTYKEAKSIGGFQLSGNLAMSFRTLDNLYFDIYGTAPFNPGMGLGLSYVFRKNYLLNIYTQSQIFLADQGKDPKLYGLQFKALLKDKLVLGISYNKSSIVSREYSDSIFPMLPGPSSNKVKYRYKWHLDIGGINDPNDVIIRIGFPTDLKDYIFFKLILGRSSILF